MSKRPPQLSPIRLTLALLAPLAIYLAVRSAVGSSTEALAITTAAPALWLAGVVLVRRRLDPIAIATLSTTVIALAAFALTGGDPLALELRRGLVTGPIGLAALASVAFGRPLLLLAIEPLAQLNPDIQARLADPRRRRGLSTLTAIIGATFAIDGASQIALALTVPTGSFVADSTAARIVVLGIGLILTVSHLRRSRAQLGGPPPLADGR